MRRHDLGLSLEQASRILKLRRDVLVAFEEGDYDHMPQSGYAQGMLSSYARYLGLNAREIVDLFQEELYEHRHGSSSHELRRRTRQTQAGRNISGYDVVNEAGSRPKAYVEYRPLLPTSGGPAGDMGNFATTAPARPRSSLPLAGVGTPAPGTRAAYSSASYDGWDVGPRAPPLQQRRGAGAGGRLVDEAPRAARPPRRGRPAGQGARGRGRLPPRRALLRAALSPRRREHAPGVPERVHRRHALRRPREPLRPGLDHLGASLLAQHRPGRAPERPTPPVLAAPLLRQAGGRGAARPRAGARSAGSSGSSRTRGARSSRSWSPSPSCSPPSSCSLSSSCVSGPSRSVGQTVAVNNASQSDADSGRAAVRRRRHPGRRRGRRGPRR